MKIDSHLHFWKYHPVKDAWITDDMTVIKKDFMPDDLLPALTNQGFDGGVAVQADQSERENDFLIDLATQYCFIKGVVGWVDLRSPQVESRLDYYSSFSRLKGFRHIVQSEAQDDFLLRSDFCRGIGLLRKYDYTYDVLIYPKHLGHALTFCMEFPDQRFVLDHIAKPPIRTQDYENWERGLQRFKSLDHVYCKIAGLINQADWKSWTIKDFERYISISIDIFGIDRVMFGSDWPVCLVGAAYEQVCHIVSDNTLGLSDSEKLKLWGHNCTQFYELTNQ